MSWSGGKHTDATYLGWEEAAQSDSVYADCNGSVKFPIFQLVIFTVLENGFHNHTNQTCQSPAFHFTRTNEAYHNTALFRNYISEPFFLSLSRLGTQPWQQIIFASVEDGHYPQWPLWVQQACQALNFSTCWSGVRRAVVRVIFCI